jgi:GAF domain-containing protein
VIYCCKATDATTTISHEFLKPREGEVQLAPTQGQTWPLQDNGLFQEVLQHQEPVYVENTQDDPRLNQAKASRSTLPERRTAKSKGNKRPSPTLSLKDLMQQFSIRSLLMVPMLYQGQLLGMVELHHCGEQPYQWQEDELALVEAIATQVGVALIQAQAYANLEDLNQQLEALDRTRSNLVAITGHELRTPLSTIQVCLESLATEPDMPPESDYAQRRFDRC